MHHRSVTLDCISFSQVYWKLSVGLYSVYMKLSSPHVKEQLLLINIDTEHIKWFMISNKYAHAIICVISYELGPH